MTDYQKTPHFNPTAHFSRIVPPEYRELFNKITDPWTFAQDKWYRIPEDNLKVDFLQWYYRNYGCIEYSETKTHFKVTFWPMLRTPGVDLTDKDFAEIERRESGKEIEIKKPEPVVEYDDLDGL